MSNTPLKIGIVEDQPMFRSLLVSLLDASDEFVVAASCESVQDARVRLTAEPVDIVLMDIGLPDGNGFGLAWSLRAQQPGLKVLLLSAHDMMDLLLAIPPTERTGWSYLSKNSAATATVLLNALRVTAVGGTVLDPDLVKAMEPRQASPLSRLTRRQFDALRYLATGRSNAAIAREMEITPHSVENLLNTVYNVLGIRDDTEMNVRVAAALMMLQHGAPADAGA